jgi:hypothetical protein
MNLKSKTVKDIINMFDDVGVWAITLDMIIAYFVKHNQHNLSKDDVIEAFNELAAADLIVWDATKSYVRPVSY